MTLEQFLEKLEQTPRGWRRMADGAIRCDDKCPISALLNMSARRFSVVARELKIPEPLAFDIATAADNDYKTELRAKLLKACGLAEVGG